MMWQGAGQQPCPGWAVGLAASSDRHALDFAVQVVLKCSRLFLPVSHVYIIIKAYMYIM